MGSRIRENPDHVFECFCEVVIPNENEKRAWIIQKYPEDFNDQEILKSVPEFSCPCEFTNSTIQHFSFVLTNLDSKWTFGYCRHTPNAPTLLVLISYLPWHETFYKILNHISDLTNDKESGLLPKFLESLHNSCVPDPGLNLHVSYGQKEFIVYCPNHLKLPSIPENRNLTEYFNAIDAHNMMIIFASMLHERRILVTSKKLSRLSACVQAANCLIYPMHWQHIFIPVLPRHLIDYLSAPMPFLIGVPSSTMMQFRQSELSEVVILDADNNRVKTPFKDLETLPYEIVSTLKRSLKNPNLMLGDGVSRAFMRALVQLIGGYRDSLNFNFGKKITFDAEAFIQTRPSSVQPFLETMLHLQIFQQFIEDRLDMLNSGTGFNDEFEYEVNSYEVHSTNNLKSQYKEWVSTMKKEGGAFLKNVKSKVKDRGKRAYKDIRSRIQDIQKHPSQPDLRFDSNFDKPKSAPSSPTMPRTNPFPNKRITYNHSNSSKMGVLDEMNLPNPVSGIRRYKMLTVDELSVPSEELCEGNSSPSIQHIDMDLMQDLHEIIYRRCSVSSDNLNSFGIEDIIQEEKPKVIMGFADSFCDPNDFFLPTPIPPPRSKKNAKTKVNMQPSTDLFLEKSNNTCTHEESLIQLESLDDVSLFDPLKENNAKDSDLLNFLAPKGATDSRVRELQNTIQNLTSATSHHVNNSSLSYFPNSPYFAPRMPLPNMVLPRYTVPSQPSLGNSVTSNDSSGFRASCREQNTADIKPPLPPKTKPSNSRFFVGTTVLSDVEKNLLEDYGLSSSPIFRKSLTEKADVSEKSDWLSNPQGKTVLNSLDPLSLLNGIEKLSPRPNRKELKNQPTWQKFT